MDKISEKLFSDLMKYKKSQSKIIRRYAGPEPSGGNYQASSYKAANCNALHGNGSSLDTAAYLRRRDSVLPRLIPVGPDEIADGSAAGRQHIIRRLAKALRGERARGRSGHWSYSLNRHLALLRAFKAERTVLRILHPAKMRK